MEEIWKDIVGYEGIYEISNLGRIRTFNYKNTNNVEIMKNFIDGSGYIKISLCKNGIKKQYFIHRLVAQAFIPNLKNKRTVNHKDGNKLNNCVGNLEWVTCEENIHHAWKNGLNKPLRGEKHGSHKLTTEQVIYIKTHYKKLDKKFGARALAKKFNVTTTPILLIVKGKSWKHITV